MKVLYLTVLERRPNRANPTGRIPGWKSILNTLAITYGDRGVARSALAWSKAAASTGTASSLRSAARRAAPSR